MKSVHRDLFLPIQNHAKAAYPNESIGYVLDGHIQDGMVYGEYLPLDNVAENPRSYSKVSRADMEKYHGRVTALVHSHPDDHPCPSEMDMRVQLSLAKPCLIVSTNGSACYPPFAWGDQLGVRDLEDRPFRSGVTDCFAAIRDWLRVNTPVTIDEQPRSWGWWKDGQSLYMTYEKNGFRRLSAEESQAPQIGDCFIVAMRSETPNHGGVYLGEGKIYHHLATDAGPYAPGNTARIEYGGRWLDYRPIWLRHLALEIPSIPAL